MADPQMTSSASTAPSASVLARYSKFGNRQQALAAYLRRQGRQQVDQNVDLRRPISDEERAFLQRHGVLPGTVLQARQSRQKPTKNLPLGGQKGGVGGGRPLASPATPSSPVRMGY